MNELPLPQLMEDTIELLLHSPLVQMRQHAPWEHATDHRRALQGALRRGRQAIDAGREDALNGFRDVDRLDLVRGDPSPALHYDHADIDQITEQFLEEKWISLGPTQDDVAGARGQIFNLQELLTERTALVARQWREPYSHAFRLVKISSLSLRSGRRQD